MNPFFKITFLIVFVLAQSGVLTGVYMYNRKNIDLQGSEPDFVVTAAELSKEFEGDENSASSRYLNKVIEVSGTVGVVRTGDGNVTSVTLETGNPMSAVICTFTPATQPADFEQGKEITIRGECSGFLMDVLLNNCIVVKGHE
jgi:hypothetical protein